MNQATTSRFTNQQKLSILEHQSTHSLTNTAIASLHGLSEGTIRRWHKDVDQIKQAKSSNLSVHVGRHRAHEALEEQIRAKLELVLFYGVPYNQQDVVRLALRLQPDFKGGNKSKLANWASTFLKKEKIVVRCVTQYGHKLPEDVERERATFLALFVRAFRSGNYQAKLVLNMDQTGVFFSNPRLRTLAHRGSNQVPIMGEKLSVRATAVLTIAMDGTKLPPYIVFKGTRGPNGRIQRSFSSLPGDMCYSVQRNAWIGIAEMERYIDAVLFPFMLRHPGERALLLLDSFSVHLNEGVKDKLRNAGFDLLFIPKGMTGILQPLDIAVNKPFKDRLRTQYTSWLESRFIENGTISSRPKPKREDISIWMSLAWREIQHDIIRNAFGALQEALGAHALFDLTMSQI
jgi:transposase-like protein